MKNTTKILTFNFVFASLLWCLPLMSGQTISAQTPAKMPQATTTPNKTASDFDYHFDELAKTPPSAADKAKMDKALNGLNAFISQLDVKNAEDLFVQGYFDAAAKN